MAHDTAMPAVRVDQDLGRRARLKAKAQRLSISAFVRQALAAYLCKCEQQNPTRASK